MVDENDKNPSVDTLNNKELIKLIDSEKYHVIINSMIFNTVGLVREIEENYFMDDNNEKFIMAFKQPTEGEIMPTILTFFHKEELPFEKLTKIASDLNINLLSDSGDLYFIAYDKNDNYSLAFKQLREFTNNFYEKYK